MKRRTVLLLLLVLVSGVLFLVFNASRAGARVEGCPAGCAATDRGNGEILRILTLNVLHGYRSSGNRMRRLDLIAEEVQRLQPDVIALQEVPWSLRLGNGAEYLARRLGLNHAYLRANGNRQAILFEEGVAILSRFPLNDLELHELQPRPGFFEHRVVLKATAFTPRGNLDVFVTHLTNSDRPTNAAQVEGLHAFVEGSKTNPAIIAGDFNATEDSLPIRRLAAAWQDLYRTVHPRQPGLTCCARDITAGPASDPLWRRLDYIFLAAEDDAALQVIDARVVLDEPFPIGDSWLWASDHAGVLVTLQVGRSLER